MRKFFIASFSATLLIPSMAKANDQLKDLINIGLKKSYKVKTQILKVENSEKDLTNSYMALLPTVSLSGSRGYTKAQAFEEGNKKWNSTRSDSLSLTTSWTIWDQMRNVNQVRTTSISHHNQKIRSNKENQEYILSLLSAYFDYQLLLQSQAVVKDSLEQSKWLMNRANELLKHGSKTRMDVIDAQIEVLNNEREAEEYVNKMEEAERKLQFLLNAKELKKLSQIDLLKYRPYFMDTFERELAKLKSNWKSDYLQKNVVIELARNELEKSKIELAQTKLGLWPEVGISATHTMDFSNKIKKELSEGEGKDALHNLSLSISLTWQLWDWWSTPRNVQKSVNEFEMSRFGYKETLFQQKVEIKNDFDKYDLLLKSIKSAELAYQKAATLLEYSRTMYRLGKINILNFQRSATTLRKAKITLAEKLKEKYTLAAKILFRFNYDLTPK